MRRKYARSWREIETAIDDMRGQFDDIRALTAATHASALALAREHDFNFHDALIVASALETRCDTLLTEDMHDGLRIGSLRVVDPFR